MCSNYLWLLIGIIIVCSCLVIYGSSSTSIKEGLGNTCTNPGEPCDPNNDTCCGCCGVNDPPTCQPQKRGSHGCADYHGGGEGACTPGGSGLFAPGYVIAKSSSKEACSHLCTGFSGCNYWGWYPPGLTSSEVRAAQQNRPGFNSNDIFGSGGQCWMGDASSLQTPAEALTEYQKLCNWGGKKNCTFSNVPPCDGGNACVPGFSAEVSWYTGDSSKWSTTVQTREECSNLCNNTSDCNYWGWYPNNLTEQQIQTALNASPAMQSTGYDHTWRGPGTCWMTPDLGGPSPSATESNTMYQKLCNWGGKKNCTFSNVPPCGGPPPAPPPPPPTCASFLSHNDCPAGTTSMAVNTPCQGTGAKGKNGTEPWNCINSLHPVNIGTCWGDTAYSKNCGGNGQSAYNQIQHLPTAGTSHCELPNPSDCEPERGYSDGGKQAYELYLKLCGGGDGGDCTSSACCTPNPKCSSLGSCPTYSNMPNSNLVCQGPVCDSTVGGECCKPNPTCSADVCDPDTQIFTGAGTQCVGPTCTQTECCKPRARCNEGVQCNPDLYDKTPDYNSKYCKGLVCELSECCIPDPTCHAYPCPTYYTDKPNKSSIKCGVGETCDTEQCCDLNPTCSSYFTGTKGVAKNGGCPTNDHLKKNAAQIRCLESDCTTAECCGVDNKCSTFNCTENNFYHTYSHIPNAENIYCNNDLCTEEQCCVATPTHALPEVETWPLYPENYQ